MKDSIKWLMAEGAIGALNEAIRSQDLSGIKYVVNGIFYQIKDIKISEEEKKAEQLLFWEVLIELGEPFELIERLIPLLEKALGEKNIKKALFLKNLILDLAKGNKSFYEKNQGQGTEELKVLEDVLEDTEFKEVSEPESLPKPPQNLVVPKSPDNGDKRKVISESSKNKKKGGKDENLTAAEIATLELLMEDKKSGAVFPADLKSFIDQKVDLSGSVTGHSRSNLFKITRKRITAGFSKLLGFFNATKEDPLEEESAAFLLRVQNHYGFNYKELLIFANEVIKKYDLKRPDDFPNIGVPEKNA